MIRTAEVSNEKKRTRAAYSGPFETEVDRLVDLLDLDPSVGVRVAPAFSNRATRAAIRIGDNGPGSHNPIFVNVRTVSYQSDVEDSPLSVLSASKFHVHAGRNRGQVSVSIFVPSTARDRILVVAAINSVPRFKRDRELSVSMTTWLSWVRLTVDPPASLSEAVIRRTSESALKKREGAQECGSKQS